MINHPLCFDGSELAYSQKSVKQKIKQSLYLAPDGKKDSLLNSR